MKATVFVPSPTLKLPSTSFSLRDYRIVLLIAVAVVVLADGVLFALPQAPQTALEGTLDEPAHVATAIIVLAALGLWNRRGLLVGALVGSVALDLDHIPGFLGSSFLTNGVPRPYTHSLTTVVVVVLVALVVRGRWRQVLLGFAIGIMLHLFRDLSEPTQAGVALFWPFSDSSFRLPYALFGSVMFVLAAIAAMRRPRQLVGRPSHKDGAA